MLATSHLDDITTYDLSWASTIARRAWQRLRETMAAEGKAEWLDQLKPFIAAGTDAPNQDEMAARLGGADHNFAHVAVAFAATLSHAGPDGSSQHGE